MIEKIELPEGVPPQDEFYYRITKQVELSDANNNKALDEDGNPIMGTIILEPMTLSMIKERVKGHTERANKEQAEADEFQSYADEIELM